MPACPLIRTLSSTFVARVVAKPENSGCAHLVRSAHPQIRSYDASLCLLRQCRRWRLYATHSRAHIAYLLFGVALCRSRCPQEALRTWMREHPDSHEPGCVPLEKDLLLHGSNGLCHGIRLHGEGL